jgi:hypothetical protein
VSEQIAVFEPQTRTFLEGGCALIIGTVSRDGEPHATRGWGLDVIGSDPDTVQIVVDADDSVAIANLQPGATLATTGGDVRTLQSVQVKGTVVTAPVQSDDLELRVQQYCDAFFRDVEEVDGTPRAKLERIVPRRFAALVVEIGDQFDQSPGPGAGARIGEAG